jgi:hypothetical protein
MVLGWSILTRGASPDQMRPERSRKAASRTSRGTTTVRSVSDLPASAGSRRSWLTSSPTTAKSPFANSKTSGQLPLVVHVPRSLGATPRRQRTAMPAVSPFAYSFVMDILDGRLMVEGGAAARLPPSGETQRYRCRLLYRRKNSLPLTLATRVSTLRRAKGHGAQPV